MYGSYNWDRFMESRHMHVKAPMAAISPSNLPQTTRARWLVWGLISLVLIVVAVVAVYALPLAASDSSGELPTVQVQRGPLVISVTEGGTVRPREQIVLKNELDDPATIVH